MKKAELQEKLTKAGIVWSAKMSVLELEALWRKVLQETEPEHATGMKWKKDPMAGMSGHGKPVRQGLALKLGIPFKMSETKGELLLKIRDLTESIMKERVTFGKYKGQEILEAIQDQSYATWMLAQEFRHPQGTLLQGLVMMSYQGLITKDLGEIFLKEVKKEFPHQEPESGEEKAKKEELKVKLEKGQKEKKDPHQIPIYTDESDSETEVNKKSKKKGEMTDSSVNSWMELGEKRKARPGSNKTK